MFDRLIKEAHLWIVRPESVTDKSTLAACMDVLSDLEKQRYRRFRFARDRHRYLVSHAMVRNVLSRYAELTPDAWVFSQADHGRPEVVNTGLTDIRFNLSHTDGLAACVVTSTCDCGVDVERVHMRHNPVGVAKRMFSIAEYEHMQRLQGREQLEYFFTRWTLREAYTKARGIGITFPTHQLDFDVRSATEIDISFQENIEDKEEDWQLALFSLTDEHIAALAIRRPQQSDKTIIRYDLMDDLRSYEIHI